MSSQSPSPLKQKHWWVTNKKQWVVVDCNASKGGLPPPSEQNRTDCFFLHLAEKHLSNAQVLLGNQEANEICSALNLVDAALDLLPNWEKALELKARALLYLRRFKDVADMLQEYIPSVRFREDIYPSESSPLSREKVKLLPRHGAEDRFRARVLIKCFSVSKLKKKFFAGMWKKCEREEWRYLVLGQACCHLGLMEDALLLLQSGKRAASAAFRRESTYRSHDSFCFESSASESEVVNHLLGNIKLLLRRKMAALAALDAGLYAEAARHLSKILDGKRGTPQGFIAECYMLRATTYQADGRVTESLADCNRTLALDPTCMEALTTRASLFETVRCFSESLQDLEHLKLLHETIIHHQKLPGPIWKHTNVNFRNVHGNLQYLNSKIHTIKQSLSNPYTIDYHTLVGLRRGCTRADIERAHLLLCLRHRPDKASHFVERCEFVDERDIDVVKDQARVSAFMLYRLLQKAYIYIMTCIMEEEAEKQKQQRAKEEHSLQLNRVAEQSIQDTNESKQVNSEGNIDFSNTQAKDLQQVFLATSSTVDGALMTPTKRQGEAPKMRYSCANGESEASLFPAVCCRDLAAVGTILSHSFHSDSWINPHQGHSLRTLPLSC